MEFQTKIQLEPQRHNHIEHRSKILLIGSCFAENIGEKLAYFKFNSQVNPLGILFHPMAIESLITNTINKKNYTQEDVFLHNEIWNSFDAHSKLSHPSQEVILTALNKAINTTYHQLVEASHIVITLGTSWVYRHVESDKIVANCHKVPQKKFVKELLSVDEVSESLQAIVSLLRSVKSNSSLIFTVSPVRHLKDGFVQNNQSKSHLLAAIHQNIDLKDQIHYFPAYELMMDELRDYRFYADDMIHPNELAINYIWNRFSNVWMKPETHSIMNMIESIQKGLDHKPFHPESKQHLKFLNDLEQKQKQLLQQFPHIVF